MLEQRGSSAKPGSSLLLLSPGLAERRAPHERLTRVGPLVRRRVLAIVLLQPRLRAPLELRHAAEHPAPQETPRHYAEEQLHLIQPRSVDRREVEHDLVALVRQERPSLRPCPQRPFVDLRVARLRHPLTDLQGFRMGIQVVHDPIVAFHAWELPRDVA